MLKDLLIGDVKYNQCKGKINALIYALDEGIFDKLVQYKDNATKVQESYIKELKNIYSSEIAIFVVNSLSVVIGIKPMEVQEDTYEVNRIITNSQNPTIIVHKTGNTQQGTGHSHANPSNIQAPHGTRIGNPSIQAEDAFEIGKRYAEGRDIPRNYGEAAKYYKFAASKGNTDAELNLGLLYENGNGVPRSIDEAARYYKRAARKGNTDAQVHLGRLHEDGRGVPRSYKEAARYYRLAADKGNLNALVRLGRLYEDGHGVPQNIGEAIRIYKLAADQGNLDALVRIGRLHEDGHGVPQNIGEAIRIYKLAADQGHGGAKRGLERLGI